jgi:hypothetical protein
VIRRIASSACALLLIVTLPLTALAGHPGGGGGGGRPGGGGGGGGRPGGAPPAAAAAMRPQMAQPAARPAGPPPGSFNVQRDIAPVEQPRQAPIERQAPVERPVAPPAAVSRPAAADRQAAPAQRPATAARPAAAGHTVTANRAGTAKTNRAGTATANRAGAATGSRSAGQQNRNAKNGGTQHVAYRRAPVTQTASGGQFRGHFHGSPVRNPRERGGNWGWNHGRQWQPAGIYWGGGFWGPFAIASIAGFALFGAIDDTQDGYVYNSYRVEPDTPGAELLNDYGLEQVACGPPGLVDIWGPDGSIVCAVPNDSVAPGDYEVDPQTFTLIPATN